MITGRQIRAGRGLVRLSSAELADLARLGRVTIVKAESVDDVPAITRANLHAIQIALESVGVVFQADGGVNFIPKA